MRHHKSNESYCEDARWPGEDVHICHCPKCNHELTGLTPNIPCPGCGRLLPSVNYTGENLNIRINWQDLRILSIWAERWIAYTKSKEKESVTSSPCAPDMIVLLGAIRQRILENDEAKILNSLKPLSFISSINTNLRDLGFIVTEDNGEKSS